MLFEKNLVPIDVFAPFFGRSIFMSHRRKLAIALPCLLVCGLVFGADKSAEQFNGSSVKQEFFLNVGVDVRPVMGAVVASDVDECQRWRERGSKIGPSNLNCFSFLKLHGQPISNEPSYQGAKYGEAASNNCKVVGGYVFQGNFVKFAVALLEGFVAAVALIVVCAVLVAWRIRMSNV